MNTKTHGQRYQEKTFIFGFDPHQVQISKSKHRLLNQKCSDFLPYLIYNPSPYRGGWVNDDIFDDNYPLENFY